MSSPTRAGTSTRSHACAIGTQTFLPSSRHSAPWGVAVEKGNKVYFHILKPENIRETIYFNSFPYIVKKTQYFETGNTVKFIVAKSGELTLIVKDLLPDAVDQVIVLTVKKID